MAGEAGVSAGHASTIERGRGGLTVATFLALARAPGVPAADLLPEAEEKPRAD